MIPTCYRRCLISAAVLVTFAAQAWAQSYGYSTFAGRAGIGCIDGAAADARFNAPQGVAVDGSGNLYVADTDNHTIRKITPDGTAMTLAGGSGLNGKLDGTGTAARFRFPSAVAVDRNGNVFVADRYNHTIRRITAGGVVTTLAGGAGVAGYANANGAEARFNFPFGVAVDGSGNVFVADAGNAVIRKITTAGVVTTFAGLAGNRGRADGIGAAARFGFPFGMAMDGNGNLLVFDRFDVGSSRAPLFITSIRRVAAGGMVSTLVDSLSSELGVGRMGGATGGGGGLAVDGNGNIYAATPDNGVIRKISPSGVVTRAAGAEFLGPAVDGPVDVARFNRPAGLALDVQGNIFVADSGSHSVRKIASGGLVTTLAGALASSKSVDGTAGLARFDEPWGVAVDGGGNVFVADRLNYTIRKISPNGAVTTFAGQVGSRGSVDGVGSAARFAGPAGMTIDRSGNLIVTDFGNHNIRRITPNGVVTTVAGGSGDAGSADGVGGAARFLFPRGVVVDGSGNIFVADGDNYTIRKITPTGVVTTFAGLAGSYGSADGRGVTARFTGPTSVAIDHDGNLLVTDRGGSHAIRKISPDGVVTTLAGAFNNSGTADGAGSAARFSSPQSLAIDSSGNILVTDDAAIRKITPAGVVTTVGQRGVGAYFGSLDRSERAAEFGTLNGIAVDGVGNLFVTDTANNTVYKGVPLVDPVRIVNVSVLATLSSGADAVTLGAIVGGAGTSGTNPLLVRSAGPSLGVFGVTGLLDDPQLEFFSGSTKINENDDWGGNPSVSEVFAQFGAFPFTSTTSKDAALFLPAVGAGNNTVRVSGKGASGGAVLTELYDATPPLIRTPTTPRLINVSALKNVGSGLTAGFILTGVGMKTVLIRADGPSLAQFGVGGLLTDPRVELFDGHSRSIASNDNWADEITPNYSAFDIFRAVAARAGAFDISSGPSKDAALLVTLAPGNYTVQVRSADSTTGVVLVEVYEVP